MSDEILDLARTGDAEAFRRLTEPYRAELQLHCYRMLGSLQDAEDALQEAMLGAWRGLEGYRASASVRAWLYRIATNCCLDTLRRRQRRPTPPEPPFEPPPPSRRDEPCRLDPYPDALLEGIADWQPGPQARYEVREALEITFVFALQSLAPRQRAVFILRDVLGYRGGEVARMLATSEDSVKAALKRARRGVAERISDRERMPPPRPGSPSEQALARRFAEAFEADEIDAVVSLLTEDAWMRMPPSDLEFQGRDLIGSFLTTVVRWLDGRRSHLLPMRANGQPAFGVYRASELAGGFELTSLLLLGLEGEGIAAISQFLEPGVGPRFGLPARIEL